MSAKVGSANNKVPENNEANISEKHVTPSKSSNSNV